MPLEMLQQAQRKIVGTKQTTKAVEKGQAQIVFIAKDAEEHIRRPLLELCKAKNIDVVEVQTMAELGQACGIDVGSASAAIVKE